MNPQFWGPPFWAQLHCICAAYQPLQRKVFLAFLEPYAQLLPCIECQHHFRELLKQNPPDAYLDSNERLFRWSYEIHDAVNRRRGKKSPAYHVIRTFYMKNVAKP